MSEHGNLTLVSHTRFSHRFFSRALKFSNHFRSTALACKISRGTVSSLMSSFFEIIFLVLFLSFFFCFFFYFPIFLKSTLLAPSLTIFSQGTPHNVISQYLFALFSLSLNLRLFEARIRVSYT